MTSIILFNDTLEFCYNCLRHVISPIPCPKVSILGVVVLWGDYRDVPTDSRDVHVQIIRRVITHRTICFYSQNTLFLKVSVHQLIPFIYFSTFLCQDCFYFKEYTTHTS